MGYQRRVLFFFFFFFFLTLLDFHPDPETGLLKEKGFLNVFNLQIMYRGLLLHNAGVSQKDAPQLLAYVMDTYQNGGLDDANDAYLASYKIANYKDYKKYVPEEKREEIKARMKIQEAYEKGKKKTKRQSDGAAVTRRLASILRQAKTA